MPFDSTDAVRARAAAAEMIERYRLPGMAVGVVQGGDLVFSEAFGFADIESRAPNDPARRHCIASISKTFVGLCAMALVDEGRLSLEARVAELLPDVRFHGPDGAMTVRHLLTHTSGIGESPTPEALRKNAIPNLAERPQPGGFDTLYPDGIIIEPEPGTKWAYANNGYALLGEIILRAEGVASLQEVIQRRIFGPLEMRDSDVLGQPHPALTTPYHRETSEDNRGLLERAGIPVPVESTVDGINIRGRYTGEFSEAMLAPGGIQSTLSDLARYATALLRRGNGIVRPETFDAMVAPQWCPDERFDSWGLSFARAEKFGRRTFGHGGAYPGGWNSRLCVIPELDLAIIIFMNIMVDLPGPVFSRIQRAVLGAPEESLPELPTDAAVLAGAAGTYLLTMPGRLTNFRPSTRLGRVVIAAQDGGLRLHSQRGAWKHGARLRPLDPDDPNCFAVEAPGSDATHIAFIRDESGAVTGLRGDAPGVDLLHMERVDE